MNSPLNMVLRSCTVDENMADKSFTMIRDCNTMMVSSVKCNDLCQQISLFFFSLQFCIHGNGMKQLTNVVDEWGNVIMLRHLSR